MSRVLVTGGTGCLGSNLCEALLRHGHAVRVLHRASSDMALLAGMDVETVCGDITDCASVVAAARGCELLFHTAAMVTFSPARREDQMRINVEGTRNVVQACKEAGVRRLVHTSSIATLGHPAGMETADENTAYNWGHGQSYKTSKRLAEREVLSRVPDGLNAVIVNPSVIVGERDIHFHGGAIVRDIKKGRIPFYIAGGMNVVYAGDVVRGMLAAAERGRTGGRYILGGENLTHREIFARTAALVGGRAPIARLPVPVVRAAAAVIEVGARIIRTDPWISSDLAAHAGIYNWYSSAKAVRELGYTITPFDETILAAYRWYREHGYL